MSKAVKERKALKRQEVTATKIAHGIRTIKQQQAKNDPIEKARQALAQRQLTVSYKGIYG